MSCKFKKQMIGVSAIALLCCSSMAEKTFPASLNDGQIAKVLLTIDEGEINEAKMAKDQSKNGDVTEFAQMMIDQHTKNESDTKALAKKNNFNLNDSDVCKNVQDDAKKSVDQIKKSSSFEHGYVDQQVTMHEKALDLLRSTLIPNAKSAALREHLDKTKQAVEAHLQHAKSLQRKLI